jgi:hypothetical protein
MTKSKTRIQKPITRKPLLQFLHLLILNNITRLIQLDTHETEYFLSLLKKKSFPKKNFILQEGTICRYNYFVNKGCLRTYFLDNNGLEHNVQFSIENWWTSDLHSFITEKPARYNVIALEESEIMMLEKSDMEVLFQKVPKFERFFRLLIQNSFVSLQERVLSNLSEPAEERYLKFREKYPSLDSRIPQNQIASFLGITPESLSRIRKKLVHKND